MAVLWQFAGCIDNMDTLPMVEDTELFEKLLPGNQDNMQFIAPFEWNLFLSFQDLVAKIAVVDKAYCPKKNQFPKSN